jgi:hypothetical protein
MIPLPTGVRVWLATGTRDLRVIRRAKLHADRGADLGADLTKS